MVLLGDPDEAVETFMLADEDQRCQLSFELFVGVWVVLFGLDLLDGHCVVVVESFVDFASVTAADHFVEGEVAEIHDDAGVFDQLFQILVTE